MSEANTINVLRGAGHPWNDKGDWDRLVLEAPDKSALALLIEKAKARFWQIWIEDDATAAAVLYKPSGAREEWIDPIHLKHGLPAL